MTTEMHDYITKLENWVAKMMKEIGNFASDCAWTDEEFIELFADMGFTEKDFQMFGYGEFVKEYFADED